MGRIINTLLSSNKLEKEDIKFFNFVLFFEDDHTCPIEMISLISYHFTFSRFNKRILYYKNDNQLRVIYKW